MSPTAEIFENSNLNPNLFRFTTAVAGVQFALWCYLSYFALTQLKPIHEMVPDAEDTKSRTPDSGDKNVSRTSKIRSEMFERVMSSKWRLSLSVLSLGAGSVFAVVAYIYPLRLVRVMTYVRPSQTLKLVTHSPWGTAREIEVPLVNVTCNTTPTQIAQGHSIALKIKDYSLFFMLNHRGININPMLQSLILNRKNV